jgi:glycosyltransferase involved in cell wall biosynthesis
MRRAEPWSDRAVGRVVHLVGRVTDEVFSFLGPATQALAESGVQQTVVLVDDLRFRHLLPRFHDSVELVLTPAARNPVRRWQWALEAFREVLRAGPTKVVQLHGLLPCLIGAWVARRSGIEVALHYSPHGSTSRGPLASAGTLLRWIAWPGVPQRPALATLAAEGQAEATPPRHPVDLVESPVSAEFFAAARNEARRPLVVTGNHINNPRSAELFAQLAVLLGGEDLGLGFNWVGTVDHGSMVRLKAAQVGVFQARTASERASRLAAGWVYLAPGGTSGFPSLLVEAMAVGLPCVAVDTPYHRDVIRHGETGYLCRTEQEIVHCIAQLIDSQELRLQIGQAAREEAQQRFGETTFRDSLFAAYDLPIESGPAA